MSANSLKRLPLSEWLVVLTVLLLLGLVGGVTWLRTGRLQEISSEMGAGAKEERISVTVEGAVLRPGHYEVLKGQTVEALLLLVGITEEADLSDFKLARKLCHRERLYVPTLAEWALHSQRSAHK